MPSIDADNNIENNPENMIGLEFVLELLKKETQIPKIQAISPDIYRKIAQIIRNLSIQKYEDLDIHHELIKLLTLCTKSLFELRIQKLLESSNGQKLSYPSLLSSDDYSKITDEE